MENFNSHFVFNKQQRSGILLLLLLILALLYVYSFVDFSEENSFQTNSSEIIALQKEIDSLRLVKITSKKPKIYPFNPNFITDYKGYTLGMTSEEIDRLLQFRKQDKWINSIKDFKRVTQVSDSLLAKISPFFKFPEWVTNPKPKKKYYSNTKALKTFNQKTDLNKATKEELQEVYGIGETLSKRIVKYREKLGGFSVDKQLYSIYGLKDEVVANVLKEFTVKTPKQITKMNLNTVSASDIATLPGISFELAKKIWEFRKLREQISNFSELEKIDGISKRKLSEIQLYLTLE